MVRIPKYVLAEREKEMNIYKFDFAIEPRMAFAHKNEYSELITRWLYNKLCETMTGEHVFLVEESFNCLSVVVVSQKSITKDDVEKMCDNFGKENTGFVCVTVNGISYDEVMRFNSLDDEVKKIIKSTVESGVVDKAAYSPSDVTVTKPTEIPIPKKEKPVTVNENNLSGSDDVFARVEKLIGMDELKSWANKMKAVYDKGISSPFLLKSFVNMSYLVSVNRGNGSSTVFRSMGDIIAKIAGKTKAVITEYHKIRIDEKRSVGPTELDIFINEIKNITENSKHYVFVIWVNDVLENHTGWIKLLREIYGYRKNVTLIFAVPCLEKSTLNDIHSVIEDIIPNTVMTIKPLGMKDYTDIFNKYFENEGIRVSEEANKLIPQIIAQESSDGRFYGINTINKICSEVAYAKVSNIVSGVSNELDVIGVEDIKPLLINNDDDGVSAMDILDNMVSLDGVKEKIKEIIAAMKMQRKLNPDYKSSMHMMFSGAPGTGKTVVARLVGKIFRENGILSLGGFFEVARKDLVGEYVGATAPKTAEACSMAYGGVLFIDEAYLLDGGSDNDYGKEAIGTLIAEMENKRGNLVVIFAGYEKDLEKLFDLNPGLRDRIPYKINFPNYSRQELKSIFYKMLPDDFSYDVEFELAVNEYFDSFPDEILNSANFSNARYVRNLVERVVSKASMRLQFNGNENALVLTSNDFCLASADSEFSKLNSKKPNYKKIGF